MRCSYGCRVMTVRHLSRGSFVLSFSRPPAPFRAGQHIFLSLPNVAVERAYSLYGAESEPIWRVLIREIPGGALTPALRRCRPGDPIRVSPPFGDFTLPPDDPPGQEILFLATGTGVAPFHSMIATNPNQRHRLIHGVRYREDALPCPLLKTAGSTVCLSGEPALPGEFQGRISDWMERHPIPTRGPVFLCGRNEMVYPAFRRLRQLGIPASKIFVELYF